MYKYLGPGKNPSVKPDGVLSESVLTRFYCNNNIIIDELTFHLKKKNVKLYVCPCLSCAVRFSGSDPGGFLPKHIFSDNMDDNGGCGVLLITFSITLCVNYEHVDRTGTHNNIHIVFGS